MASSSSARSIFGQSIYFGQSSRNEVIAAVLMLSVTGGLSALLIPSHGIFGAAWAATGGQIAACSVFIVARPRMPIPFASLSGILAITAFVLGADVMLDHLVILGPVPRIAAKLVVFAAAGTFVIWRFNILGLRAFSGNLWPPCGHPPGRVNRMRVLQVVHSDDAGGVKTLAEIIRDGRRRAASRSRPRFYSRLPECARNSWARCARRGAS